MGTMTFGNYAETVLDRRAADGVRSTRDEMLRYRKHIATSPLADKDITVLRACDFVQVVRSLGLKPADDARVLRVLSPATVRKVKTLLSAIMQSAVDDGLIDENPVAEVKVNKRTHTTVEPWTYLTVAEQQAVSRIANEERRLLVQFAIGTGLRQGEQWNLQLQDMVTEGEEPHVIVRFGSEGMPSKNGRIRRVPLFGTALAAARRWLEIRPQCRNRAVFVNASGRVRPKGAPLGFEEDLASVGITRHVRWHDLRHTCASSLVAGFWGPRLDLIDVRDMLGHSSIKVTEKYAHLGPTSLKAMAQKTGGV